MGSFYSTCFVTGITLIDGDPVNRLFILPNYNDEKYSSFNFIKEKGLLVSNDSCQAIFVPFGLPIKGKYYDYGQIINIKKTKNVILLENFFNADIDTIINAVSDDRWITLGEENDNDIWKLKDQDKINHLDILKKLTFTDIHSDVYNDLSMEYSKKLCYYEKEMLNEFEENWIKYISASKNNIFYDLELHYLFLPIFCETNMFKLLSFDETFKEDVKAMTLFIYHLNCLDKLIIPSHYGGQEKNWGLYFRLNSLTNKIIQKQSHP